MLARVLKSRGGVRPSEVPPRLVSTVDAGLCACPMRCLRLQSGSARPISSGLSRVVVFPLTVVPYSARLSFITSLAAGARLLSRVIRPYVVGISMLCSGVCMLLGLGRIGSC